MTPEQRAAKMARAMLQHAVQVISTPKAASTFKDLGWKPAELDAHLRRYWQPGWSWENHGTVWHIDHLHPLARWPKGTPHHVSCALENLRPRPGALNLMKHARSEAELEALIFGGTPQQAA